MSLNWLEDDDEWQRPYFNLPPRRRLPRGWRSQAKEEWDHALEQADAHDRAQTEAYREHLRLLAAEERLAQLMRDYAACVESRRRKEQ